MDKAAQVIDRTFRKSLQTYQQFDSSSHPLVDSHWKLLDGSNFMSTFNIAGNNRKNNA